MISEPIKVLQVVHSLGMGGAETWLMEVLRLWHKRGTVAPKMDFLATSGERGIFDDEAIGLGSTIHYLPYGRKNILSFYNGFGRILAKESYTAIHDHQGFTSGWHFLFGVGKLPRVRIGHFHNAQYQILGDYGVTRCRRLITAIGSNLTAQFATFIAGTSFQVLNEYGINNSRFDKLPRHAVYCGFDPYRFVGDHEHAKRSICCEFGWPLSSKILLFVGRIDQTPDLNGPRNGKNSGFALQVGLDCAARDASVRMVFCGAPSKSSLILQQRIDNAGCRGRFMLAGIRKDIERFMLASDILLFPSRGEGLGMVAIEAQAAGLPVLASTAVPRECVVSDELIRFLEVSEDPKQWVDAIEEILNEGPHDRKACNLAVAVSPFAVSNSADQLESLYRGRFPKIPRGNKWPKLDT
jgi:glycosyltransferase EpsF